MLIPLPLKVCVFIRIFVNEVQTKTTFVTLYNVIAKLKDGRTFHSVHMLIILNELNFLEMSCMQFLITGACVVYEIISQMHDEAKRTFVIVIISIMNMETI